jgi:hypothetical protein
MLRRLLPVLLVASPCLAETDTVRLENQRAPKPVELAFVFSLGYAGDAMPREEERFEKLLPTIKEAGFNVVHCTYTDARLALCKKQGIRMMIDLLTPEHHVYKAPEKAEALCRMLRSNPDIWGYNVWNDQIAKSGEGRRRDVNNVRGWDATHPIFCGTYRTSGMNHIVNADVLGYYDFHWKRGIDQHFPHLLAYSSWAKERDACFYSWLSASSGRAGKGNFNRNLWSANTGLACGLKGILWFLGTDLMNPNTLEWSDAGQDIRKVHEQIAPLGKELAALGLPLAVHSTVVTRTPNNDPLPGEMKERMPRGLEKHAFPKDYWLQPAGGEFILGAFQDARKRDVIFLANHNAYVDQRVVLRSTRPGPVSLFDRKMKRWKSLELSDGKIVLKLDPAAGELLRFGE